MMGRCAIVLIGVLAAATTLRAQTTGLVPLSDLDNGTYLGFPGGLYPDGTNDPPPAHLTAALGMASQVVPRDAAGNPDPAGWIGMIAIGMSNTTHEFAPFERNEDANPARHARVVIADTALGGQSATVIANPGANYWNVVQQRLAALGLTPAQVQVAWMKQAEAGPPNNFPIHAQDLRDNLEAIANILHDRFPNLRLCYVSSRTYGGYATGSLNPEPQAYESGFSVRWLIEDQIAGDPGLSYGQLLGPVRAPLLLWGPYLWADGASPRSDGLIWLRNDFEGDGTHPSPSGENKVAGMLSAFFATEPTAAPWWAAHGDSLLVTLDARHDAHVNAAEPNGNFGAAPQLQARGGDTPANVYLGFDLQGARSDVALAKLSLRVTTSSGGGGNVAPVADTAWAEGAITWNTAPPIAAPIVAMPQSSRDGTIGAAVTSQVGTDDDGLVSFALQVPAQGGQAGYLSKEGGQAPRLVLVVSCPNDGDGDGLGDACDCAPEDPTAFAVPPEVRNLRWDASGALVWQAASGGTGTFHDVMAGDLAAVGFLGTGPGDQCLASGLATTMLIDPLTDPNPGEGRFYLVRGVNVCGAGRYETATGGAERTTAACP